MQIMIDIPEDTHERITKPDRLFTDDDINKVCWAVYNGTPIPDNATVGEVFCMLACKEPICETASYFTIDKNLWNSPYQKGGKRCR